MGFLADLGRSQAVTNTTQALQNLQKNQQAIRMGEQQESLNEMELQKQKVAMQKMAEQDADLNRTIDITTSPAFLSAPPELQKSYLDFAVKGGFVDPSGRGKKRNVQMMQQQMVADEKTFESFAKPRAEATKAAVIEAYTAYQTLKDKPDADPEKLEKLFATYKKAESTYLGLTGNIDKVVEVFRAKDELQKSFATLKSSPQWSAFPPLTQALLTEAAARGDKEGFDKIVLETVKNAGSNKEVTNEYKDFIIDRMNKGDSKQQALEAWQKRQAETAGLKREQITLNMPAPQETTKIKEWKEHNKALRSKGMPKITFDTYEKFLIKERYPSYQQGKDLPPGISYDRRSGKYVDMDTGENLTRNELVNLYGEKAVLESDKKALVDLTKRSELIGTYVNRVDATSDVVIKAAETLGNKDSKLLNVPINKLKGYMGAGEWNAFNLALISLSNEIAKVESGSLGIAEVSVTQAEVMKRIHDPNLSLNDLKKVIQIGKELGATNMGAIKKQREGLIKRIPQEGNSPPPPVQTKNIELKKPSGLALQNMSDEELLQELSK